MISYASYPEDIMDMRSFDHKGFRVAMQGNSSWHEKVIIRYFFNELSSHKNAEVFFNCGPNQAPYARDYIL